MSLTRRGFSLIEVMIALVLGGMLAALAAQSVLHLQQTSRRRAERSGLSASLRTVVAALQRELEPLGVDSVAGPDHQLVSSSSLNYRAERGLLAVCRILPDTIVLSPTRFATFRARNPSPGRDSLLLYLPGDSTAVVDAWLPIPLLAGPFVATCPSGAPGWRYATSLLATTISHFRLPPEGVGRFFETNNARVYSSAGVWTFGLEEISAGATVQPVASPLLSAAGLALVGLAGDSSVAASPGAVVEFDATVRALSGRELAVGPAVVAPVRDSTRLLVRLRNVP